jgi:hypothetical protein
MTAACAAWFGVYAFLPVHLSAPDFDDFFVVDKLTSTVEPSWFNDKPFFTVWDFPYRLMTAAPGDPLACFRVNGWFALLYVLLTGLWLERALPTLLGAGWPASLRLRACLPWILACWLGPVVLSHTVAYELGCATWVLALCLSLESVRTGPKPSPAFLVLAMLALARWLQQGGHNATAMAWLPVYVHGFIVLRRWRASIPSQAWCAALTSDAVLDVLFRQRQRLDDTMNNFDTAQLRQVLEWGALPLFGALVLVWLLRKPPGRALSRFAVLALTRLWHVWLVYLMAGGAIYLFANQANLGVPIPAGLRAMLRGRPWDYATNHARYAVFFYPFLVVLVGLLLIPRRRAGLLALGCCVLAWNAAYVVTFYASSGMGPAAHAGYRRNSRFLKAMQEGLGHIDRAVTVAYLPIPRDHGDHYLIRAADPSRTFVSACARSAREDPSQPLVLTGYTLVVISKEHPAPDLLQVPPANLGGDVVVLRMGDLSPAGLDAWCANPRVSVWSTEPGRR